MPAPRIGTLLLASAWMRDVGLDTEGGGLAKRVADAGKLIVSRSGEVADPVFPAIPASATEAARAADSISAEHCDAVPGVAMVWYEDQVLRSALARLGDLPLILATLVPHDALPALGQGVYAIRISTRRLHALPSGVAFDMTGRVLP